MASVIKNIIVSELSAVLKEVVEDFHEDQLHLDFAGHIQLKDIHLKREALSRLEMPVVVKYGHIGRLDIAVPYVTLLAGSPIQVSIEEMFLVVGPLVSRGNDFDPKEYRMLMRAAKQAAKSKWFEARESAAKAAAQYRSLDPAKWADVVADVGGLDAALEEIRRRVWTPLCAPAALLDELGAERLKGVLLYGPPGCGKSYLAARLAKGLSRRAVTVVSGPEIMDKYVGSSEAQLRELFTNPPKVEPRVGDAPDVHMVAEANELHVILLDEFDAIARQRSDGKTSDTSTRDSVVNQLLALMDGVSELPVPTFVLALTNRRELVDDAVLRPLSLIHI